MAELATSFPPGYQADIVFDTTEFVKVSLTEVFITLIQAVVLVLLILFVFLQDWRATVDSGGGHPGGSGGGDGLFCWCLAFPLTPSPCLVAFWRRGWWWMMRL
jgi:hypothetical protein